MATRVASRRGGGVRPISRAELAAIVVAGKTPARNGVGVDSDGPLCRPATTAEISSLEFWIAGPVERPTALMALRTRYDFSAARDVLEVVAIDGSAGVRRLLQRALELARDRGLRFTGEIAIANEVLQSIAGDLGLKPTRTRWEVEPNG